MAVTFFGLLMDRLPLFPDVTQLDGGQLTIGGCRLSELADRYGTPLYLYDQATLDNTAAAYQRLLAEHYPHPSSITYAGKAYLSVPLARWARSHGLTVDCTGEAEIAIAAAAGVPRQHIIIHGVNKSPADLAAAIRHAGTIVVDNLSEIRRVIDLCQADEAVPALWLRFQPGLAVDTHVHRQTGQTGSKFGMDGEQLYEAADLCREHQLPLAGLHFHLGSQFSSPAPLGIAIQRTMELARKIQFEAGWHLSPGGGWGVAYHEHELPQPSLESYVRCICENVLDGCAAQNVPPPHLHLEPGRSLIARAGVALYRVGTIKRSGGRTWLLVDGGLSDNPRRALYGARYSALPVSRPDREPVEAVCIAGPFCESGDVLIEDLPFPHLHEGELIAVPVSGAYQLSMASNYNGARKPAVVMVADGQATLIQQRETVEDLLRRDVDSGAMLD